MTKNDFNKKQLIKYLLFTFLFAYAVQFGASLLYNNGQTLIGQLTVAAGAEIGLTREDWYALYLAAGFRLP